MAKGRECWIPLHSKQGKHTPHTLFFFPFPYLSLSLSKFEGNYLARISRNQMGESIQVGLEKFRNTYEMGPVQDNRIPEIELDIPGPRLHWWHSLF